MKRSYLLEIVFNLLLIVLFVGCSFIILLLGIESYHKNSNQTQMMQQRRLPLTYLTTKIHQNLGANMKVVSVDNSDVLVIEEIIDGKVYYTAIYENDHYLNELFTPILDFDLSEGNRLCPLYQLDISMDDDSIQFNVCSLRHCDTLTLMR